MTKIATIGCGLIGQGWAAVCAQAGFDVGMYDVSPEAAEHALGAWRGGWWISLPSTSSHPPTPLLF